MSKRLSKKELYPTNIGEFSVKLGECETLREGEDITLVTYGACCPLGEQASELLAKKGISIELIDIQTLSPFDTDNQIIKSLEKTNKIVFLDEDVPGGATAYMLDEILVKRNGYDLLETKPLTISAQPHRPAYSSDGDYFSKPSVDTIYDNIYQLFCELNPTDYPVLY